MTIEKLAPAVVAKVGDAVSRTHDVDQEKRRQYPLGLGHAPLSGQERLDLLCHSVLLAPGEMVGLGWLQREREAYEVQNRYLSLVGNGPSYHVMVANQSWIIASRSSCGTVGRVNTAQRGAKARRKGVELWARRPRSLCDPEETYVVLIALPQSRRSSASTGTAAGADVIAAVQALGQGVGPEHPWTREAATLAAR